MGPPGAPTCTGGLCLDGVWEGPFLELPGPRQPVLGLPPAFAPDGCSAHPRGDQGAARSPRLSRCCRLVGRPLPPTPLVAPNPRAPVSALPLAVPPLGALKPPGSGNTAVATRPWASARWLLSSRALCCRCLGTLTSPWSDQMPSRAFFPWRLWDPYPRPASPDIPELPCLCPPPPFLVWFLL